jgi:multidrug efflux system membrane fusion protein
MKASRLTAVGLVAAAVLWIASGHFMPHESGEGRAAVPPGGNEPKKLFRVAIMQTSEVPHARKLVISGRTEADKRVTIAARTGGVLTELRVKRGTHVNEGDVIAVLSDDARTAQVAQAKALVVQRQAELDAKRKLITTGAMPKLDLVNLEAQLEAAKAALATAEAELDRGVIRAPWAGTVSDLKVDVGQAAFSFMGSELLTLMSLDPMLAVVEVAERKLAGLKVGEMADVRLVNGQTARGKIRFVAKTASATTRTYRVEVEMANPDGAMPDGITCEVSLPQAPVPATQVPRSALTISSTGDIGVRTVTEANTVAFVPVRVVEDEQSSMWVAGIADGTRVIVQGQDFVREGQQVEAVVASEVTATAK